MGTVKMIGAMITRKWMAELGRIKEEYTLETMCTSKDATNGTDDMDSRCFT